MEEENTEVENTEVENNIPLFTADPGSEVSLRTLTDVRGMVTATSGVWTDEFYTLDNPWSSVTGATVADHGGYLRTRIDPNYIEVDDKGTSLKDLIQSMSKRIEWLENELGKKQESESYMTDTLNI